MDANPSTAHMFTVNPLSGQGVMALFSTHPPLEERIARLKGTRTKGGFPGPEEDGNQKQGRISGIN